jgi:hypothetical protein
MSVHGINESTHEFVSGTALLRAEEATRRSERFVKVDMQAAFTSPESFVVVSISSEGLCSKSVRTSRVESASNYTYTMLTTTDAGNFQKKITAFASPANSIVTQAELLLAQSVLGSMLAQMKSLERSLNCTIHCSLTLGESALLKGGLLLQFSFTMTENVTVMHDRILQQPDVLATARARPLSVSWQRQSLNSQAWTFEMGMSMMPVFCTDSQHVSIELELLLENGTQTVRRSSLQGSWELTSMVSHPERAIEVRYNAVIHCNPLLLFSWTISKMCSEICHNGITAP